jgi:uncharacterized protein (TIGR03435 family)
MRHFACLSISVMAAGLIAVAQTPAVSDEAFEVISIKPSPSGNENRQPAPCKGVIRMDPRLFTLSDANVFNLITLAFGDTCAQMAIYNLLSGGPDWVRSEQFDIQAVIPDGVPSYSGFQVNTHAAPKLQTMLQSLLVKRFKLALHHENKEMPVYSLVLAKGGPKLHTFVEGTCVVPGNSAPADPTSSKPCGGMLLRQAKTAAIRFEMPGVPVSTFIKGIGMRACLDRPVIDNTGVKGTFDFAVEFTPDEATPCFPAASGGEVGGPSIFTALQEQLGLRLEPTRAVVDTIVIDHIERPSLN